MSSARIARPATHRSDVEQHLDLLNRPLRHAVWETSRTAVLMVAFYLLGAGLAVTHHFVYRHFDGKAVADTQRWINLFATAIAFAIKTCLTVSIGLAFQETLWAAVRRNFIKVESLDRLFSAQSNPLSFFSWDAVTHAFLPFTLAAVAWILPFVAVFTPGTLTVTPSAVHSLQPCSPPSNINMQSMFTLACSAGGFCEGYSSPSPLLERIAAQVITGGKSVNSIIKPLLPNTLNYSYAVIFAGPALQCSDQLLPPAERTRYLYWNASEDP